MRVSSVLDEAVKEDSHLVAFKLVITHHIKEFISSILKEENLCLNRVAVEQLVTYLWESFNQKLEEVAAVSFVLLPCSPVDCDCCYGINLFKAFSKEMDQVTNVKHISAKNIDELGLSVIDFLEYFIYNFISYVLYSVLEVRNDSIVSFLEILILRIALTHFVCEHLSDYVNKNSF